MVSLVDDETVVVEVELVVVEPPDVVVVVGNVGKVTGTETIGTVVVTQPTTGRQSSGAAGALLVNAPATRTPAAQIAAPALRRAAVTSLGVGRGEVIGSRFFRRGDCGLLSTSANDAGNRLPPMGQCERQI